MVGEVIWILPVATRVTAEGVVALSDVPKDHRVNVRLSESDGKDEIHVEPKA